MKFLKPILLLVCLTLVFSLAACAPSTSKDVVKEAAQKTKDVKNFTVDTVGTINITLNNQPTKMDLDSKAQIQLQPTKAHFNIGIGTNGAKMNMESYVEGDTAYLKLSNMPQWVKANNGAQLSLLKSIKSSDPNELIDMLQKYSDKFDMKDTNDEYVLNVTSKDGKFDDFIKDYIQKQMPAGQSKEMKEIAKKMSIKSANFHVVFDKKTFYVKSAKVYLNATFKDGSGNSVGLEENATLKYSDYNKTKDFVVPKDIKDGAVEIPADQLNGI